MRTKFVITDAAKTTERRIERSVALWDQRTTKLMEKYANEVVRTVKDGILFQRFNLAGLTPRYKARKQAAKLGNKVLIATKQYYNSIKVGRAEAGTVQVQCDNKLRVLLELGTKTMRARPHWKPAVDKVLANREGIAKEVARVLFGS